jgi:hypothetical protein
MSLQQKSPIKVKNTPQKSMVPKKKVENSLLNQGFVERGVSYERGQGLIWINAIPEIV